MLRVREQGLVGTLEQLLAERKRQDREISELKARVARAGAAELAQQARTIGGMRVLAAKLDGVERAHLRSMADFLRQKLGSGLVVLGTVQDGRVALIAAATKDVAGKRVHAGRLVRAIAKAVGGGGGGRADMAEAGGRKPDGLPRALNMVYRLVRDRGP